MRGREGVRHTHTHTHSGEVRERERERDVGSSFLEKGGTKYLQLQLTDVLKASITFFLSTKLIL